MLRTPAGTLLVRDGRRIVVDPNDDVLRIEPFLVGPAFGALLYQRKTLPLHGCLIGIEDSAIAFLGPTGMGKSTVAGAFYREGYDIASDDIVPVRCTDGTANAYPTYPAVKLDPSEPVPSIGLTSWSTVDLEKRFHRIQEGFLDEVRPLARVYVLDRGGRVALSSVSKQTAVREVLHHSYRPYLVAEIGIEERHFEQCSAVAANVPVKQLTHPLTPESLPQIIEVVENDLQGE